MASTPSHRKPPDDALRALGFAQFGERQERKLPQEAVCASCYGPFTDVRPPVLLKSGHRVHIDCYFSLQRIQKPKAS